MIEILLNKCYGGIELGQDFLKALYKNSDTKKYVGKDDERYYVINDSSLSFRTDKRVVELFKKQYPEGYGGEYSYVNVFSIDDEKYPDWLVNEYDGMESIVLKVENHGFDKP